MLVPGLFCADSQQAEISMLHSLSSVMQVVSVSGKIHKKTADVSTLYTNMFAIQ